MKKYKEWHSGTDQLKIIEVFEAQKRVLSVSDIYKGKTGLNKRQISGWLTHLRQSGMIRKVGNGRRHAKWALRDWYENGILPEKYLNPSLSGSIKNQQ